MTIFCPLLMESSLIYVSAGDPMLTEEACGTDSDF